MPVCFLVVVKGSNSWLCPTSRCPQRCFRIFLLESWLCVWRAFPDSSVDSNIQDCIDSPSSWSWSNQAWCLAATNRQTWYLTKKSESGGNNRACKPIWVPSFQAQPTFGAVDDVTHAPNGSNDGHWNSQEHDNDGSPEVPVIHFRLLDNQPDKWWQPACRFSK